MNDQHSEDDFVLPLVAEQAVIRKETVETGRVRIITHVEQRQETLREALRHEDVVIDRVTINQPVDVAPDIRQEGDVLVYPIVAEELVVTKRLILKEELRISRRIRLEPIERDVTLRSVTATVERTAIDPAAINPSEPSQET